MTSSFPANQSGSGFQPLGPSHRGCKPLPRGFTLIELLVVIGIIVILLGLLLPMLSHAYKSARKSRMQNDLHVISAALEAYRRDFKDYPRSDPNDTVWGGSNYKNHIRGACMLCWALVAPGSASGTNGSDGANGPGFKVRTATGNTYGPYVNPDNFTIGFISGGTVGDNHYYFLADTNGYPYFYWPANMGAAVANPTTGVAEITQATGYVGSTSAMGSATSGTYPLYDSDDNDIADPISTFTVGFFARGSDNGDLTIPTKRLEVMLGDNNANGQIDSGETPKSNGPYLLWGLGPDDLGGPDSPLNGSNAANTQSIANCDDVTNIP